MAGFMQWNGRCLILLLFLLRFPSSTFSDEYYKYKDSMGFSVGYSVMNSHSFDLSNNDLGRFSGFEFSFTYEKFLYRTFISLPFTGGYQMFVKSSETMGFFFFNVPFYAGVRLSTPLWMITPFVTAGTEVLLWMDSVTIKSGEKDHFLKIGGTVGDYFLSGGIKFKISEYSLSVVEIRYSSSYGDTLFRRGRSNIGSLSILLSAVILDRKYVREP